MIACPFPFNVPENPMLPKFIDELVNDISIQSISFKKQRLLFDEMFVKFAQFITLNIHEIAFVFILFVFLPVYIRYHVAISKKQSFLYDCHNYNKLTLWKKIKIILFS